MPFVKKLARFGNSSAVVIDQPFLKQLDLRPGSEVEVSLESNAIVIRPHRYATDRETRAAGRKVLRGRRALMERLAK
ncbi:MAG: AbrB/MazE/SpoVT family DNA-binding domain-containing protein [Planctomycetes bacterium]|nr:AbrB/MazE/SpoVT family DNA-binding domain-containing protein [Planctomycetota bacterium]